MSEQRDTGGPAFPCDSQVARAWAVFEASNKPLSDADYMALLDSLQAGMTLRQYAAIKLRVPRSGIDWLDDMIREAQRDDDARAVMLGIVGGRSCDARVFSVTECVEKSREIADAMLKARQQ